MFPILPPFSLAVKNISEFFKIFRKFFQDASKAFQIIPTKKVYNFHKIDMEIIKPLLV